MGTSEGSDRPLEPMTVMVSRPAGLAAEEQVEGRGVVESPLEGGTIVASLLDDAGSMEIWYTVICGAVGWVDRETETHSFHSTCPRTVRVCAGVRGIPLSLTMVKTYHLECLVLTDRPS